MKLNQFLAIAAVAVPVALTSFQAAAVPVIYTSQAAFTTAIAPFPNGTDTYATYTTGASLPASVARTAGTFAYTASDPLGLYQGLDSSNGFLTNNDRTSVVTLNGFAAGVNAIGANFFGSAASGAFSAGESIIVSILETNGASYSTTLTSTNRLSFLGYRADSSIASVTFRSANVLLLWPSVDNLTVAAIPEPMTLSLVGLALLGAAAARRRGAAANS